MIQFCYIFDNDLFASEIFICFLETSERKKYIRRFLSLFIPDLSEFDDSFYMQLFLLIILYPFLSLYNSREKKVKADVAIFPSSIEILLIVFPKPAVKILKVDQRLKIYVF